MASEITIQAIAGVLTVIAFLIFFLVIEFFAKRKAENIRSARICPKCGSLNIGRRNALPGIDIISGKESFFCNDCGYEGMTPVVNEDEIEGFRKNLK